MGYHFLDKIKIIEIFVFGLENVSTPAKVPSDQGIHSNISERQAC